MRLHQDNLIIKQQLTGEIKCPSLKNKQEGIAVVQFSYFCTLKKHPRRGSSGG